MSNAAINELDPTRTDPDNYKILLENERVRVLEYRDTPGTKTKPHRHPDAVLVMLSDFERRLTIGDAIREVTVHAGQAVWSPAQVHAGENTGSTDTHLIFVELKD